MRLTYPYLYRLCPLRVVMDPLGVELKTRQIKTPRTVCSSKKLRLQKPATLRIGPNR